MSEIRIVDVNVTVRPLATNQDLMNYEATNMGGWMENVKWGVLLVFDSPEERDAWKKGKP